MTNTKTITEFRVTWTADHEQYWQGHGTAFTDYTHCATGVGETLREAFEDALEDLAQQDIEVIANCAWCLNDAGTDCAKCNGISEPLMLAELTVQVKEPEMLDWDIVKGYCPEDGDHTESCTFDIEDHSECPVCLGEETIAAEEPDCAVCAGEWHYYVSIDVKVEE